MAVTYEPIASTTVSGTNTNSISFSSIPSTWTDLILVCRVGQTTNTGALLRLNNDSTNLYSWTSLYGNGSSAASGRNSTYANNYVVGLNMSVANNTEAIVIIHLMSYANTNVYKTWLHSESQAAYAVSRNVGLYRSTSAITQVEIVGSGTSKFSDGSTFALYGIKAA